MIAFLSDFGLKDPYVGIVKGVVARISPSSKLIDITHDISPGNVKEASFVLSMSFPYFPEKTVFLAVVDPGVGSGRRGIVVEAGGYRFVGPDNGIFSHVLRVIHGPWRAYEIAVDRIAQGTPSRTFHARDVFGPLAALLDSGLSLEDVGPGIGEIVTFDVDLPEISKEKIVGKVVYLDRFGNAITNIPSSIVSEPVTIMVRNTTLRLVNSYEEGRGLQGFGIMGSHGYLEISSYLKSVQDTLDLREGDEIIIVPTR